MINRKYYSFERNNYFYGKLLTSKDFQNEQGYMNDKRRLINRTLHGMGIVYGMDIVAADDSSIILQSGMALDAGGREIVVPQTQVIKLSTIEGYSELQTDKACLIIEYAENKADPVYATMEADGNEKQHNRIKESYRLFLKDAEDCAPGKRPEDDYITSAVLYQDEEYIVTQYVPVFTVPGMVMKGRTEIRKIGHMPCTTSFSCTVVVDGCTEKNVKIQANNFVLEYGEALTLEQQFHPETYVFGAENIALTFSEIEMNKSGETDTASNVEIFVKPVQGTVLDYVHKNSYNDTMDVELDKAYDEKLILAQIDLIRSNHYTMIDKIFRAPFEQYVYSTGQLMVLEKLHEFICEEAVQGSAGIVQEAGTSAAEYKVRETSSNTSGVFEMSLGNGGEVGKSYFSEEIMHGLGTGPVYVEIGIEYISRDGIASDHRESIILGDGSIFAEDETVTDEKIFEVDHAVKLLPSRGTFIVGIRPKVKMGRIGLRIRWYAFKPEDLEQRIYNAKEQKGCIMVQPDTIVIQPKGTVHISPVFINMPEEALVYTLLDPEGGKIDNNGIYSAPAQEGVYEIKVSVLAKPEIYTHAFVIVSQRKNEE